MTTVSENTWPAGMKIVNPDQARNIRDQGMIRPPRNSGYVYLAAEIERPHPLKKASTQKQAAIHQIKQFAAQLIEQPGVDRADVFRAVIIPSEPEKICLKLMREHNYEFHVARFDLVVLVECSDIETAKSIRHSQTFESMYNFLKDAASYTYSVIGSNPICIDNVSKETDGIFLFNHFYSDGVKNNEPEAINVVTGVWEYTAGWWTAKANLTNSTPIQPLEGENSDYALINHCRWDRLIELLPSLIFRPTLKTFVVANFTANRMISMPILYRLA